MDLPFGRERTFPMREAAPARRIAPPGLRPFDAARRASRTAQVAARLRAGVTNVCAEGFVAVLDPCEPAGFAPCGSFHPRVAQQQRRSV